LALIKDSFSRRLLGYSDTKRYVLFSILGERGLKLKLNDLGLSNIFIWLGYNLDSVYFIESISVIFGIISSYELLIYVPILKRLWVFCACSLY